MTAPTQFPAFLSIEYDGRGDGFPAFERAANASLGRVDGRLKQFQSSVEEVGRVITKAIAGGVSGAGGLDLGVGQFRQAAAEARLHEAALRELQKTTSALTLETGDTSQATKLYNQAINAQLVEARQATAQAEAQVKTYTRLQESLDNVADKNSRLAASYREVYAEQARAAQNEVRQGQTQQSYNSVFAPGLTRSATSNGAGFGALAAQLEALEEQERAAALAAKQYEQALFEIRQQVDPASFAQKRFNQELAYAQQALKTGDITTEQYAKRLAFLRGEMVLNATSTRQMRFASVQLGQQLQDVVIQAQMGTNAFVILAQQGSQMAFALTEAGGTVGKLARAMAGWQGAIVFAGVALVGQLIPALLRSGQEASKLSAALDNVKFSSDAVQSSQGILGNVMDIATGKIITQRQELLDLAEAQLLVAQVQAQARQAELRSQIQGRDKGEWGWSGASMMSIGTPVWRGSGVKGIVVNKTLSGEMDVETAILNLRSLEKQGKITKVELAEMTAELASFNLETANIKSFEAAERLLKGKGNTSDRALLLKPKQPRDNSREIAAIAEKGEDAAKKIANITDRFSDIPPQVRSVNAAMRELDDLADDFARKKPPNYEAIKKAIDDARAAIKENGLDQSVNDLLESMQQQLKIGELQAQGKVAEAASLQQILQLERQRGQLSDAQVADIVAANEALRQQTRELERQQAIQRNLLNFVQDQRDAVNDLVYNLLSGKGLNSISGFVKNIFNSYLRALSEEITQELTGDFFQKQTDKIKGETKLSDAGERMAKSLDLLKSALDDLRKSVKGAAGDIADAGAQATTGAANDNDIVVNGRKSVSGTLKDGLKELGKSIFGEKAATKFGEIASRVMQGAAIGTATSGILKSLGIKQSKTGAQIGGAIGSFLPIPGGNIIGSIIGGTIGGLFKKTKEGSARISVDAYGNVGGAAVATNHRNKGSEKAAIGLASSIGSGLSRIAQELGGAITGDGGITIGVRDGQYRVDELGQGNTKKSTPGVKDFDEDAEAAIKYAIKLALERGVLSGIRESTSRLLKEGEDLDSALEKALKFENVFRDLKRIKDPVGAAIDDLNREFKSLVLVFKEAGATAEETAQLEELYGLKRKAAVEDAIKQVAGSLDDLYKNLTIGNSGYSLRTRLGNAKAAYDPLAARVAAGDTTAYDDFSSAAQTLIELQREYSGSAPEYFAVLDQVTQLTKGELDRQRALFNSAGGAATPFDTQPIVDATQQQTTDLVSAISTQTQIANDNTKQVVAAIQSLVGNGFGFRANF